MNTAQRVQRLLAVARDPNNSLNKRDCALDEIHRIKRTQHASWERLGIDKYTVGSVRVAMRMETA